MPLCHYKQYLDTGQLGSQDDNHRKCYKKFNILYRFRMTSSFLCSAGEGPSTGPSRKSKKGILSRISDISAFQTSTKIEALVFLPATLFCFVSLAGLCVLHALLAFIISSIYRFNRFKFYHLNFIRHLY
jgi:hypothetical protein